MIRNCQLKCVPFFGIVEVRAKLHCLAVSMLLIID